MKRANTTCTSALKAPNVPYVVNHERLKIRALDGERKRFRSVSTLALHTSRSAAVQSEAVRGLASEKTSGEIGDIVRANRRGGHEVIRCLAA
ncbi:hypothetical protein KM043_008952 [Ampulex compressa]|nr:hypothetical protein KM043_008952 [Ampulex compressa]